MKSGGGARGAAARLEWNQMPGKALHSKVCRGQSEDFSAALQRESYGIVKPVKSRNWLLTG